MWWIKCLVHEGKYQNNLNKKNFDKFEELFVPMDVFRDI